MIRTYVDTGVLIAAFRGAPPLSTLAYAILNDPNREFVASEFVRLEALPKPTYYQRSVEAAFYEAFLSSARQITPVTADLVQLAFERASAFGLSAVDALHVAAAETTQASELVTTERPTSPLFRVSTIQVVSIQPPAAPPPATP